MAQVNPEADSRERIIVAAEALIAERGLKASSLAEIAAAAGMSRGTLFYHFPSKEDLVLEIAERHIDRITERIVELARSGAAGGSPAVLAALLESVLADRTRAAIHVHLVELAFEGKSAVSKRLAASYRRWIDTVAAELASLGLAAGRDEGSLIVAAIDGLIVQQRVLGRAGHATPASAASLLAAALGAAPPGAGAP